MKNNKNTNGLVYSTDPNFKIEEEISDVETLQPNLQKLRIWLETKRRAGKAATLISGFIGKENDLETLGKILKNTCGTGGSIKDGKITIQGDQREKVLQWLLKNGYTNCKKVGG